MPDGARRGRPRRSEPAEPTGHRVTAPVRRQLIQAMAFVNERSLQGVLDLAVDHWLRELRRTVPGFAEAVDAAEANVVRVSEVTDLASRRTEEGEIVGK